MRFTTRLNRNVMAWLRNHPELVEDFAVALADVRAGVNLGEGVRRPGDPRLYRLFRFGPRQRFVATFEVDVTASRIEVFECGSTDQLVE